MEIVTYTVYGSLPMRLCIVHYELCIEEISGGYCSGVPPLPIPNREVKPACADGTAMQCGRVGGRHFYRSPGEQSPGLRRFIGYLIVVSNLL